MLECSLHYDAEALMVLYGFIAGRGALSAAREDYFQAFCLECKMLGSPSLLSSRGVWGAEMAKLGL